ncbi:hypothetical protein D0863_07982 [Lecanosticta acicola]|uniref:GRIP domain-containing protein n=1 Tax=Lecanosticta acicola TaxID=111012 RepID=A0AAI8Z800_9PEZI|nr:hypothetical protein D0863_07982 [Lecanosticta acicola]
MFQRLQKGLNLDFLDGKIAEEQEKQKQQQQQHKSGSSAKRSPSVRRGSGRTGSPSTRPRAGSRLRVADAKVGDGSPAAKGPDPEDFVIGDDLSDMGSSRAPTPLPGKESDGESAEKNVKKGESGIDSNGSSGKGREEAEEEDLPLDVRQKLAKLDTLTARYQDLLRNYRTAHAHVASIEPFEATLREHTPLTSISDPGALVEFLNQRSLQSSMVLDELKKVSEQHKQALKERDELKTKLEEAEKTTKEAFDQAAGLEKGGDDVADRAPVEQNNSGPTNAKETNGDAARSTTNAPVSEDDGAFFSYEDEVSRDTEHNTALERLKAEHAVEVKKQTDYINELSEENVTLTQDYESLRHDMEIKKLDLDAMYNKVRVRADEIAHLENENKNSRNQLKQAQEATEKADAARADAENKHAEQEKRLEILQNLVNRLREQVKIAEDSKRTKEQEFDSLQFEAKRLEAEVNNSSKTIAHLRQAESSLKDARKKAQEVQDERDEAQRLLAAKKGHEQVAASLRSQLKQAIAQRDEAYQTIINCGKCERAEIQKSTADGGKPDGGSGGDGSVQTSSMDTGSAPEPRSRGGSEATISSSLPPGSEAQTPATEAADELAKAGEAKKKKNKKKKPKAKKKSDNETDITSSSASLATSQEVTVEDLLRDPELAPDVLLKAKFGDNPMVPLLAQITNAMKERSEAGDEGEEARRYLEDLNEQLTQNITDKDKILRAKAEEILELQANLAEKTDFLQSTEQDKMQTEQRKKEVASLQATIAEKDTQIKKFQERLHGESALLEQIEELKEEKDSLQESMLEHGTDATNAKHELKETRDRCNKLQEEFDELQREADNRRKKTKDAEAQRDTLNTRCADLESEISTLKNKSVSRDELEGVKEQLASTIKEKQSLQLAKETCEKELEELKSAKGDELDAKNTSLLSDLEALRTRTSELEKELADANQLAQSRYKDLCDVRGHYHEAQVQLKRITDELAELKNVKADLEKSQSSIKRLEARQKDLTSEIAEYKSQASEKDREIVTLKDKVKKGEERSSALEDSYETARKDLEKSESMRNEAQDSREKLQGELKKTQDDLRRSRPRLDELEQQVKKLTDEASSLRDELQLKAAQQASAQSLMDSMRDERNELATQMKEVKDRNESLEEEIADAHRLLSERGREGETMRRLLADVEKRAETTVKEMKEKMDLAIEERDRAEDEASTIGRRKAREIEDLKNKLRDAEREANRAKEAREEAERKEASSKSRQTELQEAATRAQESLNETRKAMAQLQESFDETDRQSRELEKEKLQLRKELQERETRIDKIQASSRTMAEELKTLRSMGNKQRPGSGTPSRSSVDSSRVTSPVPRGNTQAASKDGGPDLGYLRTVLLQFLEQREKKYQMQLVPVLGQLLQFGEEDRNKLMGIVTSR